MQIAQSTEHRAHSTERRAQASELGKAAGGEK